MNSPEPLIATEANGVLTLTLQSPPVNALATPVRLALLHALTHAQNSPDIRAIVLTGSGTTFSAGADLHEFEQGTALDFPSLHADLAQVLLQLSKPVVAAINGLALGGGFELALWCHARVAVAAAKLGLPETTLGLMPGAGGTQLLPRAVGLKLALDMVLHGQVHIASDLNRTPLLQQLTAPAELLACSSRLALALAAKGAPYPHLSACEVDSAEAPALLNAARAVAQASGELSEGRLCAMDSVAQSLSTPFAHAVAMEHARFLALLGSPLSKAIRGRFLASRTSATRSKHPAVKSQ